MLSIQKLSVCFIIMLKLWSTTPFSRFCVNGGRLALTGKTRAASIRSMSMSGSAIGTRQILSERVKSALEKAFGSDALGADAMVLPAKPEHGDYQCNAAMPLAKKLKLKPRDIAEKLVQTLQVEDVVATMDISGPGFINIHLADSFVKNKLIRMLRDPTRLGIAPIENKQRIIVDFSSPNIAKEMHVGHLRSTIIGDSLSRVLEFLGHDVLRLNHVGDWGTQFGMLIRFLYENHPDAITENAIAADGSASIGVDIGDLVMFYKAAKKRFDEDPVFQEAARAEVVRLQSGDPATLRAWKAICDLSRGEFQKIYDMLDVQINERGESFYNPLLPSLVEELESSGAAVLSDGAKCIFLPGYTNPDGTPQPMIVKKSDGGFLYATTDLAAVRQRSREEKADRVLYVTDVGQSQHFEMVFAAARASGLAAETTELKHVPFGLVQGEDGKKFKTRAGDTVKLKDLLNEAVKIAEEDMAKRSAPASASSAGSPDAATTSASTVATTEEVSTAHLTAEDREAARIVGIGAVKYADLSMNRESNYRFSYKKMLSLNGNTAPYMLYAYARIQGIRRRAAQALGAAEGEGEQAMLSGMTVEDLELSTTEEVLLVKQLLRLDEILEEVAKDLYPNKMCEYLFELSQRFNQFYERCPVLKAETPKIQRSRAALCSLTADTLKLSLGLLGIKTVERL